MTSDRRIPEQRLDESAKRFRGIIESAMDAIITVDERQRVLVFNVAAENIFKCSAAEAIGKPLDKFIPARFREAHRRHVEQFGQTGVTSRSMQKPGTLYGLRSDGEEFPLEATISQVESEGQRLYTVILRDITERKKAEEALLRSEKLASAGQLAASIAHEINNPLASTTNLLYLALASDAVSGEVRRYLEQAEVELKRVAHITRQTLGFYREDSSPSRFRGTKIMEEVATLLNPRAAERGVRLDAHCDERLEIHGVAGELRQVAANLVTNAIDAVPEGGSVEVRLRAAQDWRNNRRGLRLTVADTGSGIEPANLSKIVEPFFTTKKEKGTGLGLWVTNQIVTRQGGSLRVRSRITAQSGSVFTVFLPFATSRTLSRAA
jgi:PAS domain S-box-containing protein